MKKYWIFIILLCALIPRLTGIGSESYWLDETISVRWAQANLKTSLDMVVNDVHPPMYMLTLWVWVRFFGITPIATRILSTIFSLVSIFMIYLLGKKLFSEKIGLIASAILAFSAIDIYYSQETRAYSFFVLFTLFSFYYFISTLEKISLKNSILYFFSTLILMYTHVFSLLILLTQNIFFLLTQHKSPKKIKKWVLIQIHLLMLYLPWLIILLKQMTLDYHTNWIPVPHWYTPLVALVNYSGSVILFLIFIILIVIAMIKLGKQNPWEKNFLLGMWIIVPIGIVFVFSLIARPLFHERFFLFVVPAIVLLVSWALSMIFKNKWILCGVVAIIIFLSIPPIYEQYYITNKDDWIAASKFLNDNVKKGEIIFIHPFYQQDPFTYYFNKQCFREYHIYSCNFKTRNVLSVNYLAKCCNESTILTSTSDKNYLMDYTSKPMWVVDVRSQIYDKESNLYKYLNNTMKYQYTTEFYGGILIHKYIPKK
jgi:mannosyltransferase